jgi:hypothetical protein
MLLAGSGCEGDKHRTYTIQDASEFLGTLHHARSVLFGSVSHVVVKNFSRKLYINLLYYSKY